MTLHAAGNKCYENSEEEGGITGHSVGKPLSDDTTRHSGRSMGGCISSAPVFPFDLCFEHLGQRVHDTHS